MTLQPPAVGEALTADEIFDAVSPAVAIVETLMGSGIAILIEDNYLLTHARTVWPRSEVRVLFPDGSEHPNAPVAGWDLVADLALVGPIETEIEPVRLVGGGDLPIGSDVYLIGYPDEEATPPQPSITTGILSQLHRWESIDYTFFQVDAAAEESKLRLPTFTTAVLSRLINWETIDYTLLRAIAAVVEDRSGGVMITHTGDVVGLSTFAFDGFKLAASIADALPRLNTILGHDMGVTIEQRDLPQGEGQHEFERTFNGAGSSHRYLLQEPVGTEIEINVEGAGFPHLSHQPLGVPSWAGAVGILGKKQATLNFTVERSEFNIIKVWQSSENENSYLLTSSHPLLAYPDPDDYRILAVGDSYTGVLDVILDVDNFELQLKAGDRIQIEVDSIDFDPWIALTYRGDASVEPVSDDDGGGGLFGENGRIVYEAPQDGTFFLHVLDQWSEDAGSYFVNVTAPTEAALLTKPNLTKWTARIPYGKLVYYETDSLGFRMFERYEWVTLPAEECERFLLCYFWDSAALLVAEIPLHELPPQERSRAGFINSLDSSILHEPGSKKLSAETIDAGRGVELDRLDYSLNDGRMLSSIFVHFDETEEVIFSLLAFTSPDSQHQKDSLSLSELRFYGKITE